MRGKSLRPQTCFVAPLVFPTTGTLVGMSEHSTLNSLIRAEQIWQVQHTICLSGLVSGVAARSCVAQPIRAEKAGQLGGDC